MCQNMIAQVTCDLVYKGYPLYNKAQVTSSIRFWPMENIFRKQENNYSNNKKYLDPKFLAYFTEYFIDVPR